MRRIPRELGKQIDRLSWCAHVFHRFAHHPLCEPYSGELVRLGTKARICRGCLSAAIGLAVGTTAGLCLPRDLGTELSQLGIAAALSLLSLRIRLRKSSGRFLPAAFAAAAVASAASRTYGGDTRAWLVVALALLLAIVGFIVYRRRGPERSACASCPERHYEHACSGLAPIIRRERAFQRLSRRWLDAASK